MKRRRQRGAALVEFALVSGLLCLLLFGIIEMGLLFGDQALVGAAAREAARSAAVGDPTATARSHGVSGGAGLSPSAVNIVLEQSDLNGLVWQPLGDLGANNDAVSNVSLVRATVTYSHPLVTSYIFTGGARTLTARLVMRRE
jgi:Flp pilus assembly protein TadG